MTAKPPTAPCVLRVVNYENELGYQLVEREVVSGSPPPGFVRFVGTAHLDIRTPRGVARQSYRFPIDADSLDRAFTMFEICAKSEGDALRDRMVADARRQTSPLLDPTGRPLIT